MYTIGRLARKHHLSRSTLLYYDSIGLLRPSARSESNYRYYTAQDAARLEQICVYRRAGLPLKEIKRILDAPQNELTEALENRLSDLNEEVARLREQQRFILGILQSDRYYGRIEVMNRDTWVSLLEAAGFSQEEMLRWHVQFERMAPDKHRRFLEFLCLPEEEIERIRSLAARGLASTKGQGSASSKP